jgi:hypothetical protein
MRSLIPALLIAACFVLGGGWREPGRAQKKADQPRPTPQARRKAPEPVDVYVCLRDRVLKVKPEELGLEKAGSPASSR